MKFMQNSHVRKYADLEKKKTTIVVACENGLKQLAVHLIAITLTYRIPLDGPRFLLMVICAERGMSSFSKCLSSSMFSD